MAAPLSKSDPATNPLDVLSDGPAATLLVVLLNIVGGIVVIIGQSSLSFEQYLTLGAGSAAALSIGRALAAKGDAAAKETLLDKFNAIPWATVLVFIYAVVGGVVLAVGKSGLEFDNYITLVLAAGTTLGFGRGLAQYKIDKSPLLSGNSDPAFQQAQADANADIPEPTPEQDPTLTVQTAPAEADHGPMPLGMFPDALGTPEDDEAS